MPSTRWDHIRTQPAEPQPIAEGVWYTSWTNAKVHLLRSASCYRSVRVGLFDEVGSEGLLSSNSQYLRSQDMREVAAFLTELADQLDRENAAT